MFTFNITVNDGVRTSITVFIDGVPYVATKEHPNFDKIYDLVNGPEPVDEFRLVELFDLTKPLFDKFDHLSERVTVSDGSIFFDGDPVDNGLADAIVNYYLDDNDDYIRLVLFMEKLYNNPNAHSRENLYSWLKNNSFSIAPDGDIIAYKGLGSDGLSIQSGRAIVDGVAVKGRIPNRPGSLIEMPRNDVQHDPANPCSTGLHAGTWSYAHTFGSGKTIRVKINPRDVVSVPTDCAAQKMRTCRYRCLYETDSPVDGLQYSYQLDEDQWDETPYDWSEDEDYNDEEDWEAMNEHVASKREQFRKDLTDMSIAEVHGEARNQNIQTLQDWGYRPVADIIDDLVLARFPS